MRKQGPRKGINKNHLHAHTVAITHFIMSIITLISLLAISLACYSHGLVKAAPNIEISINQTEHIIVDPFERACRFVAHIMNKGTTLETIYSQCQYPDNWVMTGGGNYQLAAGESADCVVNIDPPANSASGTVHLTFSWVGGSQAFDLNVKTKTLTTSELAQGNVKVTFHVLDKTSNKAITNAVISASFPGSPIGGSTQGGLYWAIPTKDGYELNLPSGDYMAQIAKDYQIAYSNTGYFVQVTAQGYQGYFQSNYLPKNGDSKSITLEPLNQVVEYSLQKTVDSGFSLWWIRASADNQYFAFSQGTHGKPGQALPDSTKVLMTDDKGNVLWERQVGGMAWGLDISPDGQYVAAGSFDMVIRVWNRNGDEVWHHSNAEFGSLGAGEVRWVKFSPDGKYLLAGPVRGTPELAGLFDTKSGQLVWTFNICGFLREGRFSADGGTVYLGADSGMMYAVDTLSGQCKWLGSAENAVPFLLAVNEQCGIVVSGGKGCAVTALNLANGTRKWQIVIDTSPMGQMADNGTVVVSTGVGWMIYAIDSDGSITWARKYGGAGHNGVCYTMNGKYVLLGGPNPTLLDDNGNVLWQREKDKLVPITGVDSINTGGANVVWIAEDASILILGGDDGKISFYKGSVKTEENKYSQLIGFNDPTSAWLRVSDLVISPVSVNPLSDVSIKVSATNIARSERKFTISLKINGIGEQNKDVTLGAVSSQQVEFKVSKNTVGAYQVDVNGLTGSFEIVAPVMTTSTDVRTTSTITTQSTSASPSYTVLETQTQTITPTQTLSTSPAPPSASTSTSVPTTMQISETISAPSQNTNWGLLGTIAAVFMAGIAGVIYATRRRKRHL